MAKVSFLVLIAVAITSRICAQCPSCDQYLNVIYDKTHIQQSDNFTQSFASWFFSDDFRTSVTKDKSGLSITIPLDGVPITFGGSDESSNAWTTWQQNKGSTKWDFSKISKQDIYKEIASPESRRDWYNCIAACPETPLPVTVQEMDNEGVILTFKYNRNLIENAPTVADFICSGGIAVGDANKLYANKKMTLNGFAVHFKWADQTTTRGTVILNTSHGSTNAIILSRIIPVNQATLSFFTTRIGDWNNPNEVEKVRSGSFRGLALGMQNVTDNGCPIRSPDGKYCAVQTDIPVVSTNQLEFLTNLSYHAWGCPGCNGGWSQVMYSTPSSMKAYVVDIMVKNWGPASGWELDYDVYRSKIISSATSLNIQIINSSFTVDVPAGASYPIINLQLINKQSINFAVDGDVPSQLTLTSKNHLADGATEYIFQIKD